MSIILLTLSLIGIFYFLANRSKRRNKKNRGGYVSSRNDKYGGSYDHSSGFMSSDLSSRDTNFGGGDFGGGGAGGSFGGEDSGGSSCSSCSSCGGD
jgi:hypothetical protein